VSECGELYVMSVIHRPWRHVEMCVPCTVHFWFGMVFKECG